MKTNLKTALHAVCILLKWLCIAALVGVIGGVVGSLFHHVVDSVTEIREEHTYIIALLPIGGLVIAGLYKLFGKKGKLDTNRVIEAVRTEQNIPLVMLPLIFISTVITHFFGGSAGREGAALQLGGSIGYNIGKTFRLNERERHIIVMAGMSAVFTALFGTPLTAAIFSLEVSVIGTLHYTGLFPCLISSFVAAAIAKLFHINPVHFSGVTLGNITWDTGLKIILLAALCALLSILFCFAIKKCEHLMEKYIKNSFYRILVGGAIIVLLTALLGTTDYNGAGMGVITRAIEGTANYEAFLLKILFTAITIAAGFKGGEIVPTFFIGATFGCVMASVLGLPAPLAASIGFVALFCGMVNCPIASLFLGMEVFGFDLIPVFAIAVSVSYMLSGGFSLYHSQKLLYSKTDDEFVDTYMK